MLRVCAGSSATPSSRKSVHSVAPIKWAPTMTIASVVRVPCPLLLRWKTHHRPSCPSHLSNRQPSRRHRIRPSLFALRVQPTNGGGTLIGTTPGSARPMTVGRELSEVFEELRFAGDFQHGLRANTEPEVLKEAAQFSAVNEVNRGHSVSHGPPTAALPILPVKALALPGLNAIARARPPIRSLSAPFDRRRHDERAGQRASERRAKRELGQQQVVAARTPPIAGILEKRRGARGETVFIGILPFCRYCGVQFGCQRAAWGETVGSSFLDARDRNHLQVLGSEIGLHPGDERTVLFDVHDPQQLPTHCREPRPRNPQVVCPLSGR